MANLFYETFDDLTEYNANWINPFGGGVMPPLAGGVELNGNWISPCTGSQAHRNIANSNSLNINFICCSLLPNAPPSGGYVWANAVANAGAIVGTVQYIMSLGATGIITFRMNDVASGITSPVSVIPTNGSSYGLQMILTATSNFHVDYSFLINNVVVWSGTYDWTAYKGAYTSSGNFERVSIFSYGTVPGSGNNCVGIDNLSVENTTDEVDLEGVSYLALITANCSGRTANPVTIVKGSGIYTLDPTVRHDKLYRDTTTPSLIDHVKFPDPFVDTYLIGDE